MANNPNQTTRQITKLAYCSTQPEQTRWAISHLESGGRLHDIGLWLGGIDQPLKFIGAVKVVLRLKGRRILKSIEPVTDAAGEVHQMLVWRLQNV